MLKNGKPFGKDYFDELPERIREIRASELMAEDEVLMSMQNWIVQTNQFLATTYVRFLKAKEKSLMNRPLKRLRRNMIFSEYDRIRNIYQNLISKPRNILRVNSKQPRW